MRFIPSVSLHGSGETVRLSNYSAEHVLMQGSTGLGMGPREISTVALPSGGSLVRHRRTTEATPQIPFLLGGSEVERWDLRRRLERLVKDEVELRVTRPNGVSRSLFGYYKQGLEGSYGAGEDSPNGQKLVLDFLCPDPLWKGELQGPEFRLSGLRKKFLTASSSDPSLGSSPFLPIRLASSTVQGEFDVVIAGDAPAYPTWIVDAPGADLIIENDRGESIKVLGDITERITITTEPLRQDISSASNTQGELWEMVPPESVFFPLTPGTQRIRISMVGAKPNSTVWCSYRENFWAGW